MYVYTTLAAAAAVAVAAVALCGGGGGARAAVTSVSTIASLAELDTACDTAGNIGTTTDHPTAVALDLTVSGTGFTTLPASNCAACVACTTAFASYTTLDQSTLAAVQRDPNMLAARACLRVSGAVVGSLRLGSTDDCVVLDGAAASFKGTLDTGLGNDCVLLGHTDDTGATFRGKLELGEGDDALFVDGASFIGKADAGMGNDFVQVRSVLDAGGVARVALVDGGVWAGAGRDTLTVLGVDAVADDDYGVPALVDVLVGREGDDLITVAHNAIVSNVDGGDGDDTLKVSSGAMVESLEGEDGDDVLWLYGSVPSGGADDPFASPIVSVVLGGDHNDCIGVRGSGSKTAAYTSSAGGGHFVGKIDTGRGDDSVVAENGFRIDGPIEMTQGSDVLVLRDGAVNNDVRGGGGTETLRLLSSAAIRATGAAGGGTTTAGGVVINGDVSLLPDATSHVFLASATENSPEIVINGALLAGTAAGAAVNSCEFRVVADTTAATSTRNSVFMIRDGVQGCISVPLRLDTHQA